MLKMSLTSLGNALGVSVQQMVKYESGANRLSAGRLQHISSLLQVPVAFFFDGVPHLPARGIASKQLPPSQSFPDLMTTYEALALAKAFTQIGNAEVRRRIVELVEQIDQARNHPDE
jgi:transcriptional regulator with XRE-family HTH domain